jgi:hypothetical protein
METENDAALIIQGITESGGRFRPSDWAERLAGNYARVNWDRRVVYSEDIAPATREGVACLVVRGSLARANPTAYAEVMCFARMNQLVCVGLPQGLADSLDATAGRAPAETARIRPSP